MTEMHTVAQDAIDFVLESGADPGSPYRRAAAGVQRALAAQQRNGWDEVGQALSRLADVLESDLRPDWPNDPEGKQRAMVDHIRAVTKKGES